MFSLQQLYEQKQYHLISPVVDIINGQLTIRNTSPISDLLTNADQLLRSVLTEFKTASVIILEKTLYECSEVIVTLLMLLRNHIMKYILIYLKFGIFDKIYVKSYIYGYMY